jgi:hypothetical protein
VVSQQRVEIEGRFSESTTELMTCMSALDPRGKFVDMSEEEEEERESRLLGLLRFYPREFNPDATDKIKRELRSFKLDFAANGFPMGKNLEDLCVYLVSSSRVVLYPIIHRLVVLVLTLPVSTATGERAFSKMKLIKGYLRSSMSEGMLSSLMVLGIETDLAKMITNEQVIQKYMALHPRRVNL